MATEATFALLNVDVAPYNWLTMATLDDSSQVHQLAVVASPFVDPQIPIGYTLPDIAGSISMRWSLDGEALYILGDPVGMNASGDYRLHTYSAAGDHLGDVSLSSPIIYPRLVDQFGDGSLLVRGGNGLGVINPGTGAQIGSYSGDAGLWQDNLVYKVFTSDYSTTSRLIKDRSGNLLGQVAPPVPGPSLGFAVLPSGQLYFTFIDGNNYIPDPGGYPFYMGVWNSDGFSGWQFIFVEADDIGYDTIWYANGTVGFHSGAAALVSIGNAPEVVASSRGSSTNANATVLAGVSGMQVGHMRGAAGPRWATDGGTPLTSDYLGLVLMPPNGTVFSGQSQIHPTLPAAMADLQIRTSMFQPRGGLNMFFSTSVMVQQPNLSGAVGKMDRAFLRGVL
jgi:hypothetical protein